MFYSFNITFIIIKYVLLDSQSFFLILRISNFSNVTSWLYGNDKISDIKSEV